MMQQVATKRSDIAALPVDVDSGTNVSGVTGRKPAFNEAFSQAAHSYSENKSPKEKNADDVTVAKEKKTPPPVSKAVSDSEGRRLARESAKSSEVDNESRTDLPENDRRLDRETSAGNPSATDKAQAPPVDTAETEGETPDWLAFVDAIRNLKAATETTSTDDGANGDIDIGTALLNGADERQFQALESLITRLKGDASDETAGSEGSLNLSELAASLNEAVNKLLASEDAAEQGAGDAIISEEVMQIAASLLAALTQTNGKGQQRVAEHPLQLDGQVDAELVADAELLVSLIKSEQGGSAQQHADSKNNAEHQQSDNTDLLPPSTDLMTLLSSTQDNTQTVVAEALADKVVTLLPDRASDSQKAEIRQGVIDAVKAYQAQLDTGSEPQVSLESMIADAIGNAGLIPEENIDQRIAGEMRQLSLIVSTATQVANSGNPSVYASAATQAENTTAAVQGIRAEQHNSDAERPVNIHQPEGQQQLAEKVRWMVNARNSMAEIRLDPPELGSMQVRVNVSGDTASVSFVVQSAQAREALAQAEPRLRDMLAEQGINLGESFVSQQQQGNAGEQGEGGRGHGSHGESADHGQDDTQVVEQSLTRQAQGGIDDYA